MAVSLRPCPTCGRPMDSTRTVCAFCQQAGSEPTQMMTPAPTAPLGTPSYTPPISWGEVAVSALIPLAGVILGVWRHSSGDRAYKRQADADLVAALIAFGIVIAPIAWMQGLTREPTASTPPAGSASPAASAMPDAPSAPPAAEIATIQNFAWEYDDGARFVGGTVVNNTDRQLSYVQVVFPLFDDSGAQVGSALDNVNNLAPRGRWKFRAIVLEDRATKAKSGEVTAY